MGAQARAEGKGRSVAGARWAAMKELERLHPEAELEAVVFETVEQGERSGQTFVRVVATAGGERRAEAEEQLEEETKDEAQAEPESEADGEADAERQAEGETEREDADRQTHRVELRALASGEWPAEPRERAKTLVEAVLAGLEIAGTVEVSEEDEELVVSVEGEDVGLLIGRHGQTIDAVQLICMQATYRGEEGRKRVVVDAAGYRARRAEMLERQADRAASDALRADEPVDLDPMSAQERRVVHSYLKDRPEVETHSEGEEPYRFVVISPVGG